MIALDLSWRPDDVPAADLPRRGVFAWFVQELADHLAVAPRLDADDGPVAPAREAVAAPRPLHGALLLAAAFAWCVERLLSMADGAARPER